MPGDLAVVQRKAELLGVSGSAVLLRWLEDEAAAKGAARVPVGFRPTPSPAFQPAPHRPLADIPCGRRSR